MGKAAKVAARLQGLAHAERPCHWFGLPNASRLGT
jgi:hypothetical protein